MNHRLTAIVLSTTALAMAAAAQTTSSAGGIVGGIAQFAGGTSAGSVSGRPYSALQQTETVQTLADGTHITQGAQKVMFYRDSLGRTRTERTMSPPPGFVGSEPPPTLIEITDSVAGFYYTLDANSHVAHRTSFGPARWAAAPNGASSPARLVLTQTPLPAPPPPTPIALPAVRKPSQRPMPTTSQESLGTQSFEGVLADGTRMTTVYPVGFFGNDRPITTVDETWTSRELGMTVLQKMSDPRRGDTTTRLTGISQSEPDAALFQIPADYEIVDPK
jgi:hypothetical protein